MTDKKIVDDYYSSQNVQWKPEDISDKKPKISIKWKIKVKKEEPSLVQKEEKKEEAFIKTDNKKTEIIQNISPVKKEFKKEDWKKPEFKEKKDFQKRPDFNWPKKEFNWPKRDFNWPKKEFVKKDDFKHPEGGYITRATREANQRQENNQNNQNNQRQDNNFKVAQTPRDDFFSWSKPGFVAWKKKDKKSYDESDDNKKWKFFKKDKNFKHFNKNVILEDDELTFSRSNKIKQVKKEEKNVEDIKQNLVDRSWEEVIVGDILTLKEFSEKIWVPIPKLIAEFMKNGMKVTLNSKLDFDTASIIADAFQIKLQKDISSWFSVEDLLDWNIQSLLVEEDSSKLVERPPVISIMWHVDHWKTSLLDYIRKTKVADKEAGWITQSIWAYQVEYNDKKITFLDTPGHEAFTIMRARWAKSTDIAILVVAADEWVKPQTIESINHAREANIQIIVAITKIDKDWANIDNVKSWLSSQGLISEDWGWDVPMVWVSAKTWEWVDDLLELILIASEMLELKANPERLAVWTVIESHLDMKLWPVSTVLINTWTLTKWDCIVCKWAYWRVKVLKDHVWKNVHDASLSQPVLVVWLDSVTEWWDIVQVVSDIEKARVKALEYKELMASKKAMSSSSIDLIMSKIKSWSLKQLKVVLKSDTNWSLEAVKWALLKLSTDETKVTIIHSWVWNITEWDVLMCQWSSAILVWYNVEVLWTSKNLIEDKKIEYISSKIIYHITERVEKIVTWMLDPKEVEVALWEAKVWWIFYEWEWFMILWLKLNAESKIIKWVSARIIKDEKIIWKWVIENLKSWIVDVVDIEWPTECWIKLKTDVKVEMWDILEIFKIEIHK